MAVSSLLNRANVLPLLDHKTILLFKQVLIGKNYLI